MTAVVSDIADKQTNRKAAVKSLCKVWDQTNMILWHRRYSNYRKKLNKPCQRYLILDVGNHVMGK